MPPKQKYTKQAIIDAAFELATKQGIKGLTARKVADQLKCSTAPVYSYFENMKDLEWEVYNKTKDLILEYTRADYTEFPFRNIGIGIVLFARDQRALFRSLFMESHDYKAIIDDFLKAASECTSGDRRFELFDDTSKLDIMMKMWFVTHGLASMICVNVIENQSREYIEKTLSEIGNVVIGAEIEKAKNK